MDNFCIDITAEGDESLKKTIEIAFEHNCPGGKATHYQVFKASLKTLYYTCKAERGLSENIYKMEGLHAHHSENLERDENGHLTLVLLWSEENDSIPLPYTLGVEEAFLFIKGWLKNAENPGKEPDIDGGLGDGWRVFTEDWGHVAGNHYAIVGIQSVYSLYGK